MTNKRLIDLIRFEAKLPGSTSAVAFVYETLLEVLRDFTAIDVYRECLMVNTLTLIGASNQPFISLPADYQHLKSDRVRYRPTNDFDSEYFLFESEQFDFSNTGQPRRYQLARDKILLFPSETVLGDSVVIDYYLAITDLPDADEFPIPSLQSACKKAVIARLQRLMGKDATSMETDSNQSLVRSKGDGTDNK